MHTDTHTHKPMYHKTSSFIKSSCERSRIKGSMWNRAVVLQRRSGPDGVQSVRQTCSALFYPALLRYVSLQPLRWSFLSPLFFFYGFPVLVKSNRNDRGDMQQRRWAGCKPTMCLCVCCVPWLRATRTSVCVFLITKTTNRNRTRYCQERIKKERRTVWMLFLRGFGGYSVCPNMCSGSQSHDLQQMVEQKARLIRTQKHTHTHTTDIHTSSKSCVGRAWLMVHITVDKT